MSEKKVVGYTTGVFDLFHIGHLNILKAAKQHCDYLIVGVSTDELVQKYKNNTPVIPYQERRAIVESIKYVDKVVPQINRDKMQAWKEHGFDKMFVGDDWKTDAMFQQLEKDFREVGVEICYFPYTKGVSSTILTEVLNKIRNQ